MFLFQNTAIQVAYFKDKAHIYYTADFVTLRGIIMSVELIRKPINLYQLIDEQQREELTETGIIVPDSKPDVLDVLAVDTSVIVKNREKSGKVMEISGELNFQVIYRADNQEQSIEAINVNAPWSVSCNYPAGEENIHTLVKSAVEHTNVEIVNGRKLSAKSVVKLNVKYLAIRTVEAGENVQGENVYQKADLHDIAMIEDIGETTINVSEILELSAGKPAIEEILYSSAMLKDLKISENDTLEAVLAINILYRPDNDSTQLENEYFEIPVSKSLELDKYYTNLSVNTVLKTLTVKPDEDLDGLLTRVRVDAEINAEYILYSRENVNLVNDAYATDYDFELEKMPVTVSVEEQDITENVQINANIPLECGGENLEEILSVGVKPKLLSVGNDTAGVEINGCLDVFVLYGTGTDMRIVRGANQEVQFTHRVALPETNARYDIDPQIQINDAGFDIASKTELGIKTDVAIKIHLSRKSEINVVTGIKGIKPVEKKENPPLIIYYTQDGDTLWSIARKYRVSIQKIMNDNGMTEEIEPEAGQKIFLIG
ncbi:peptidoglycan-binding protein LysM [Thermoclostridium stercorarium subsp. stercorarium DSM 8532]|uniref:Peptidoglycan-binding protein LysM n=3 Tax=Thermoclostridium stercorarium TaxID=1510 RepID=L7VKB5_THES1|nr:peptidoglycan-binding protein LysM [Thermoclostridium stercorarium subsp. stercorarium DSM 8532]ANW97631.1 peptidoglycan-binding protein [Thermoclostridium stercorarium subsp. thermolacticum DSM 2910]